jgi:hypothetical protein
MEGMMYYRKTSVVYDDPPVVKTPVAKDLADMETAILDYIAAGKKTDDEITKEILVNQSFAVNKGATGNDVANILKSLKEANTLESTTRDDGKFLEPSGEI